MAENDSLDNFTKVMDSAFDQIDEAMDTNANDEAIAIERSTLFTLWSEAQKLKVSRKFHNISLQRLLRLLSILERCVCEIIDEEGTLKVPIAEV